MTQEEEFGLNGGRKVAPKEGPDSEETQRWECPSKREWWVVMTPGLEWAQPTGAAGEALDGKPSVPLCPPVSLFSLTGGKRLGVLEQQQAGLYRPRGTSPSLSPITSLGFPKRSNVFEHIFIWDAAEMFFRDYLVQPHILQMGKQVQKGPGVYPRSHSI